MLLHLQNLNQICIDNLTTQRLGNSSNINWIIYPYPQISTQELYCYIYSTEPYEGVDAKHSNGGLLFTQDCS